MTPEDQKRLKAHLKEVASILYRNTDSTELSNFESIEKSLRQKMLYQFPKIVLQLRDALFVNEH
jgi:hypothetical protein